MLSRTRLLQGLLILYFLGSLVVAVDLLFGYVGHLADSTSEKLFAAAIISLGVGALIAATDPLAHRVIVQVLILFTTLASLALLRRIVLIHERDELVWLALPLTAAAAVLLCIFYPRTGRSRGSAQPEQRRYDKDHI